MLITRLLIGLGVFVIISIVGLVKQFFILVKKKEDLDFLIEYHNDFISFCENISADKYTKLLVEENRAQELLADHGFVSVRFPFENGYHTNVPVISLIPKIIEAKTLTLDSSGPYISLIEQALLNRIGYYTENLVTIKKNIINVFVDFYLGFNFLVSLPFLVLGSMFLGKNLFVSDFPRSIRLIARFISFVLQAIGVFSGIMSIILGYSDFIALIKSWL